MQSLTQLDSTGRLPIQGMLSDTFPVVSKNNWNNCSEKQRELGEQIIIMERFVYAPLYMISSLALKV